MNAWKERALGIMNALLQREGESARIKSLPEFLCSAETNPPVNALPESWARDWCEGWAFAPSLGHADALGLVLARRQRTEERLVDGRLVKEKTFYRVWTQTSAFDFRAGYLIHSAPSREGVPWGEQIARIGRSVQVLDAMQASPGGSLMARDPGFVSFRLYYPAPRGNRLLPAMSYTLTQDDFVRYLITGDMGEDVEEDFLPNATA